MTSGFCLSKTIQMYFHGNRIKNIEQLNLIVLIIKRKQLLMYFWAFQFLVSFSLQEYHTSLIWMILIGNMSQFRLSGILLARSETNGTANRLRKQDCRKNVSKKNENTVFNYSLIVYPEIIWKHICIKQLGGYKAFLLHLLMRDILFSKCVLTTYFVPGTVIGTKDIRMNQRDLYLQRTQSLVT